MTGVFKALEGYLKKLKKNDKFSMFYKQDGKPNDIYSNEKISLDEKDCLNKLYKLYKKKRSHYIHSPVDPINLPIIEDLDEAENIRDEILEAIENAYIIIFNGEASGRY